MRPSSRLSNRLQRCGSHRYALRDRGSPTARCLHPSSFILFFINLDLLGFAWIRAPASNPVGAAPATPGAPPRGAFTPIHPALQPKTARFGRIRLDLPGFAWIQRSGVQSSRHSPDGSRGAAAGCIHTDSPGAPTKSRSFWSDQVGFAWICLDSTLQRPIQLALPRRLQRRRRGVHSLRFTQRLQPKTARFGRIKLDLPGFAWIGGPASNPVGAAPTAPAAPPRSAFTPIHPAPPAKNCSFWSDQVGFCLDLLGSTFRPPCNKAPCRVKAFPLHPMKNSPPSYFIIQPSSFHP